VDAYCHDGEFRPCLRIATRSETVPFGCGRWTPPSGGTRNGKIVVENEQVKRLVRCRERIRRTGGIVITPDQGDVWRRALQEDSSRSSYYSLRLEEPADEEPSLADGESIPLCKRAPDECAEVERALDESTSRRAIRREQP
jgi:hypothetical protein